MLNPNTFDPGDALELQRFYNLLRNRSDLRIVSDATESGVVLKRILTAISLPYGSSFSIQNLFCIENSNVKFYIAQCLNDFGFPVDVKLMQSSVHKCQYQTVGYSRISVDLGNTYLRPETKNDRLVARFFSSDIEIEGYEKFNHKYYLASNRKDAVQNVFEKNFVQTLAKHNRLYLRFIDKEMYMLFDRELNANQGQIVEEVFSSFNFLSK